jgi:uncharacterized membrane protein
MKRDDIHIISRHSNASEQTIQKALNNHVYSDQTDWKKFFNLFIISLGVGFTVAGIIFFFAYNWADMHKFVKIGLTQGILIITTSTLFFLKLDEKIKNIILTGASVLVGVLFAVFGQIYQTGANAYDFFLGWTVFVTLWAIVSDFAPLWLIYFILINTTLYLYTEQVAKNSSITFVYTLHFIVNMIPVLFVVFSKNKAPNWFLYTMILASVTYATLGISIGIFEKFEFAFLFLIIITGISYVFGLKHGLQTKNGFYLSVIPFSLIIIASAVFINISNNELMFLFISMFIIVSVTFTILNLINYQKKWNHEE